MCERAAPRTRPAVSWMRPATSCGPPPRAGAAPRGRTEMATACYIYGIVPGDVELTPDARGLSDRPIRLVRRGDIAALVSEVEVSEALGRPEDLRAHEQLLDA